MKDLDNIPALMAEIGTRAKAAAADLATASPEMKAKALEAATEAVWTRRGDIIAANDISADDAGFGVDTNRVTLLFKDGSKQELEKMSKGVTAEVILEKVVELIDG